MKARVLLLLAALLFSTGGAAVKHIEMTGWQIACFRSLIALVAFLVFIPGSRQLRHRRVWLVAVSYGATLVCFALANKLTTAANAIYLQATAPIYVVLLSPILLREPVKRRDLGFMAALAGGLLLFFMGSQPATDTAPAPLAGNIVGVFAGVFWALTMLGLRWLARDRDRDTSLAAVAAGNTVAFLIALPFALPMGLPSAMDGLALTWLGVFQIALAYVFLVQGIRHVSALEAALLLLLEPVLSPLWAYLLHREVPAPMARLGCLVILVATLAHSVASARRSKGDECGPGPADRDSR